MPTRQGWLLAAWSVVVGVGGRILGVEQLYVLAAAGVAVVVAALVWVRIGRPRVESAAGSYPPQGRRRRHVPGRNCPQARIGTGSIFELRDGTASPVHVDETGAASYVLTMERRGLVRVGPATLRRIDPLRLASRSAAVLRRRT